MVKNNLWRKIWFVALPIIVTTAHYYLTKALTMGTLELFFNILKMPQEKFIDILYLTEILQYLILMIIFFVIYKLTLGSDDCAARAAVNAKDVGISFFTGVGVSGISFIWLTLAGKIPALQAQIAAMNEGNQMVGGGKWYGVLLSAVIAAPIVEEVVFRGIVFGSLRKIMPAWLSVLVSAVVFGAYHINPVAIVYASIMGIIAGIVYEKKRNLIFPIILHIANNFIGLLQDFVPSEIGKTIVNGVSLVMIIPMGYIIYRLIRSDAKKEMYAKSAI